MGQVWERTLPRSRGATEGLLRRRLRERESTEPGFPPPIGGRGDGQIRRYSEGKGGVLPTAYGKKKSGTGYHHFRGTNKKRGNGRSAKIRKERRYSSCVLFHAGGKREPLAFLLEIKGKRGTAS